MTAYVRGNRGQRDPNPSVRGAKQRDTRTQNPTIRGSGPSAAQPAPGRHPNGNNATVGVRGSNGRRPGESTRPGASGGAVGTFDKLPEGAKVVTQSTARNGIPMRVVAKEAGKKKSAQREARDRKEQEDRQRQKRARVQQISKEPEVQVQSPVIEAEAKDSEPEMLMGGNVAGDLPLTAPKEDEKITKPPVTGENVDRDTLPPGSYWSDKFERYMVPKDPDYSEDTARRMGAI